MRRSSCEAGLCTPGVSTKTICAAGCLLLARGHLQHANDAVARGLRLGRDNGDFLARQGIEQRAFAHVGPAENGNKSRFQTYRSPSLIIAEPRAKGPGWRPSSLFWKRQARHGWEQPHALDAAACGGDDLHPQSERLDRYDLAGCGNAARDLAHQTAKRSGFVVFTQLHRLAD